MFYFLQGLTMGLAYVAPIGLQNLYVIDAAMSHPRKRALLTAFIVVFFDISLALACFVGMGAVMERWDWLQKLILPAGSLIVIRIGIGLLRSKEEELRRKEGERSLLKTAGAAFVVTWCNPQALIDGTMMLGAFHISLPAAGALSFILGVSCASCLWFTALTLLISLIGSRFSSRVVLWINRVCGAVIIGYGIKLLVDFFRLLF